MTERTGIVVKTDNNTYAHVATHRNSACGGCHIIKSACYGCLSSSSRVISRVANPVGAKVGDLVKIRLDSSKLFTAAAMFYLIPVIAIMAGAFSGSYTSEIFGVSESIASMGGAGAGLVASLTLVTLFGRLPGVSKRIEPAITAIMAPK